MKTKGRSGLIAGLDVGTTKVCCFVARAGVAGGDPEIIGLSHQLSRGVRRGNIVDMRAAEDTIRSAVHAAEEMANDTVDSVVVSISGGMPASRLCGFDTAIHGPQVSDQDLQRLFSSAWQAQELPEGHQLIHTIPTGFSINGENGISDPRGMVGERLGTRMNMISAQSSPIRNLQTCLERCHLDIEAEVIGPYASGLGCLVEDEMDLGVTIIDMGGGTTDIAVFMDGELIHVDTVPVGGTHVTNDIARGLTTPVAHAERMKVKFGSCLAARSDDHEIIRVPLVGEDEESEGNTITRAMLVRIIQPRIEETLELIRERLELAGLDKISREVVLTGGASQLCGMQEMAARVLSKVVRPAKPHRLPGLADAMAGPEFSTCVGLVRYAQEKQGLWPAPHLWPRQTPDGLFGKLSHWLRENF